LSGIPEDLSFIEKDVMRTYLQELKKHIATKGFDKYYSPQVLPQEIDLLKKMLTFHPAHRLSIEEVLSHG